MILETGRVVAIEAEGLWVETIQKSTCNSCRAEPGCGQAMLTRLGGQPTSYLWVLLQGREPSNYHLGDEVQIGVPEEVIAKGSLFVYMLPLLGLLSGAGLAHHLWSHEAVTFVGAILGLLLGGVLVRWRAHQTRFDPRLQPVLVDDYKALHITQ